MPEFMGGQVQEVTVEIVVTRADGTVEDLGVVSRTVYDEGEVAQTPVAADGSSLSTPVEEVHQPWPTS